MNLDNYANGERIAKLTDIHWLPGTLYLDIVLGGT